MIYLLGFFVIKRGVYGPACVMRSFDATSNNVNRNCNNSQKCSKMRHEVQGIFVVRRSHYSIMCVFGGHYGPSVEMHLETSIAAQKLTGNVEDGIVIGST